MAYIHTSGDKCALLLMKNDIIHGKHEHLVFLRRRHFMPMTPERVVETVWMISLVRESEECASGVWVHLVFFASMYL